MSLNVYAMYRCTSLIQSSFCEERWRSATPSYFERVCSPSSWRFGDHLGRCGAWWRQQQGRRSCESSDVLLFFLKTYRIHVWYTLPETNIAPRSHQGISHLPSPLNFTSWNWWICTIIPVYTFTCVFSSTLTPIPFPFYLLLSTLPLEPGESESLGAIRGFWQTIWDRPRPEVDDAFQFWQAQTLLDCQNCNGPISRRKNFKVRL